MFERMPINANDKEKIAHLNAERLLGLGRKQALRGGAPKATSANDTGASGASARRQR
jgi:hypothetical protein